MTRFCERCGTQLKPEAAYCTKCGQKADEPPSLPADASTPLATETTAPITVKVSATHPMVPIAPAAELPLDRLTLHSIIFRPRASRKFLPPALRPGGWLWWIMIVHTVLMLGVIIVCIIALNQPDPSVVAERAATPGSTASATGLMDTSASNGAPAGSTGQVLSAPVVSVATPLPAPLPPRAVLASPRSLPAPVLVDPHDFAARGGKYPLLTVEQERKARQEAALWEDHEGLQEATRIVDTTVNFVEGRPVDKSQLPKAIVEAVEGKKP